MCVEVEAEVELGDVVVDGESEGDQDEAGQQEQRHGGFVVILEQGLQDMETL